MTEHESEARGPIRNVTTKMDALIERIDGLVAKLEQSKIRVVVKLPFGFSIVATPVVEP